MQTARKITISDTLGLDLRERIELVEAIWDSIAEVPEAVELTHEQREELGEETTGVSLQCFERIAVERSQGTPAPQEVVPMLFLRPEAERDLAEASESVRGERPGLGSDFLAEVDAVFEHVEATPAMYQKVQGDIRRALTRRFPYGVFYVLDSGDVVVIAVLHAARNPRAVKKRRKPR